ncbi:glycosyltransferase [Patescibacteria group bacterium]|nr:glycosyltransferase [Patescibacteria group bacterium]MBU1472534.1 glycosyltransferase [Patescibacteria group bacterium]MBU2460093.1 glycosyltransferase [Patescibacteria group bacterium]
MRIGILLPSIFTSKRYGEGRIFAPGDLAIKLADGLVSRGHEVKLYTSKDVVTKAQVIPGNSNYTDSDLKYFLFRYRDTLEQKYSIAEITKRDFEYDLTLKAYQDATKGELDIIHSYHDFGAHYFNELTGFPTVYTIHDPMPQTKDTIEYQRYLRFAHHNYISISFSQRKNIIPMNFVATIYHGVSLTDYEFSGKSGEYLTYFGRILADKGVDIAIAAAKQAKIPFVLATSNIRANRSGAYYDEKIAPQIDEKMVRTVGFLTGKAKSDYIKRAIALVFPLKWEEPFGMILIEAMACGVPVIAYNRGSVPEIVRDGVTGFIIEADETDKSYKTNKSNWLIKKTGAEGLVEAIGRIGEIDRDACRKHVEENFTVEKMTSSYEAVYQQIIQKVVAL